MKTIGWFATCLLILFALAACTPPADPVSVTRPVTLAGTAVPTLTNTPHAPATTDLTPTIAPTNTPDPVAAQATFLETLRMGLNGRQFDGIEDKMTPSFLAGIYPVATAFTSARDAIIHVQTRLLPQLLTPNIEFHPLDTAEIPPHLTAAKLFGENAEQITVVGSSGWGMARSGQALVYLLAEGDSYLWTGLVVGYGDFKADLDLETIAAPPGLIYLVENGRYEYWQIDANGEPQLLIAHNGRLSLNPTATLALMAEQGNEFVTLFDLTDGSSEVIAVSSRLMGETGRVVWLDAETALLLMTDEPSIVQQTYGFPALLNVTSGEFTRLEVELSVYTQPAISANGVIAFGVSEEAELQLWQDRQLTTTPIASLETWPNHFGIISLSPNGFQAIGLTTSETEPGRIVYLLANLEKSGNVILHAIHAVPTDAILPWNTRWSPNGQWLALSPAPWDVVEGGAWLVRIDGTQKIFLGPGSGSADWLDAERVIFSAFWNGQYGLQLYNLATKERNWLDTPQFAATLGDGFWVGAEKSISPVQLSPGEE